jgi:hypothetical protein
MSSFKQQEIFDSAKELALKGLLNVDTLSRTIGDRYTKIRESNEDLDEHCGIAVGTVLTLFGGQFATTFAFVEAFQQTGFRELVENGRIIQDQLTTAKQAVINDESVDEDRDGTADISRLSPRERVERKYQVFVRNVDPDVVHRAISALWLGFLTASAAVKLKFAKVIALGASVGDFLEKPAQKYLLPRLKERLDEKYHRWLPTIIEYICRAIGISIAFRLYRILATVSTSIRGGEMILRSINALCLKKNMQFLTNGPADEILALGVVATGVYAQLLGPQSSMLVRVLLFPLAISEQILTLWVGTSA